MDQRGEKNQGRSPRAPTHKQKTHSHTQMCGFQGSRSLSGLTGSDMRFLYFLCNSQHMTEHQLCFQIRPQTPKPPILYADVHRLRSGYVWPVCSYQRVCRKTKPIGLTAANIHLLQKHTHNTHNSGSDVK